MKLLLLKELYHEMEIGSCRVFLKNNYQVNRHIRLDMQGFMPDFNHTLGQTRLDNLFNWHFES